VIAPPDPPASSELDEQADTTNAEARRAVSNLKFFTNFSDSYIS
jgi:hypothetical protein